MKVNVKIMGVLNRYKGKSEFEIEIPGGAKIEDLYNEIGYNKKQASFILAAVNGKQRRKMHSLNEDDNILLSMTVGGG